MYKVVKGAKYQSRPSASYFYDELNVPVGFTVQYRPRKGGKMITHTLQLRNNGTPYWKAEEKLPVKRSSSKRTKRTKGSKKRGSKKRGSKRRGSKGKGPKRRGSKGKGPKVPKRKGSRKRTLRGGA